MLAASFDVDAIGSGLSEVVEVLDPCRFAGDRVLGELLEIVREVSTANVEQRNVVDVVALGLIDAVQAKGNVQGGVSTGARTCGLN